jgi:hypothetical protein
MLIGRKIFFYMYPEWGQPKGCVWTAYYLKETNRSTHEEEASDAVLANPN